MTRAFTCWLILGLMFGLRGLSAPVEIRVCAAASLSEVLQAIAKTYTNTPSERIVFNFAASSTLARQIAEGSPADIFFSADESNMDKLAAGNWIVPSTRTNLLGNSLVCVESIQDAQKIHSASDLTMPGIQRIAIADPSSVPAGIYAKQFLEQAQLWTKVRAKIIPTDNVRGSLAAVESGNVDAAILYKTDALHSQKVRIAFTVTGPPAPLIRYPVAVLRESLHREAAVHFVNHLCSEESARIFIRHGFVVLGHSLLP